MENGHAPARPRALLPLIVFSQFAGTSLWFAGNVAAADLPGGLHPAWLASAVQLGFVAGTLASARLRLADRHNPATLFLACCLAGALCNYPLAALAQLLLQEHAGPVHMLLRLLVGAALAGIYPVGIKIAASWYGQGLGMALGYLTGALVLGTAFPHLVQGLGAALGWHAVLGASSALAVLGGLALRAAVPTGPHARPAGAGAGRPLAAAWRSRPRLRAAAGGYFGHMWELYAFWAFVPFFLAAHAATQSGPPGPLPLWTFAIIAAGALGCIGGGELSQRWGSAPVALCQLSISGLCCLLSPLAFGLPTPWLLAYLAVWGVTVVGDSAQFSALVARAAPADQLGSIVTQVNCIGFAITAVNLPLLGMLAPLIEPRFMLLPLLAGPLLGLWAFVPAYFGARAQRPAP